MDRGHAEVSLVQLTLDHVQGHALPGHLDGVGVAESMWCEPAPDTSRGGWWRSWSLEAEPDHGRPRVGPLITQNSGPTRIRARCAPRAKLLPSPIVHAGLATLSALSVANEQRAALGIEISLRQVQGR
jgi:hypothetical protein